MRRALAALAVATLSVLGAAGSSSNASHDLASSSAPVVREATSVVRVAAVAVAAPQLALPSFGAFAVLAATALASALLLGYLARQRRRATFVPVLASTVRRRGPPAASVHR